MLLTGWLSLKIYIYWEKLPLVRYVKLMKKNQLEILCTVGISCFGSVAFFMICVDQSATVSTEKTTNNHEQADSVNKLIVT